MKNFSVRIDEELLKKLHYVAESEARSANCEINRLIRERVRNYDIKNGRIEVKSK